MPRRRDRRPRADGAAIRAHLTAQHRSLRFYAESIGRSWRPLDHHAEIEFSGWQVPAELRQGFGLDDRLVLRPDDTVVVIHTMQ